MSEITASLIMAAPILIERKNHNEVFGSLKNLYIKSNKKFFGHGVIKRARMQMSSNLGASVLPRQHQPP
jgi:hypothetical protein